MDSLAADSWQRLHAYTSKGSFKSYLASLSWRLLEDFSRKRFGRVRPPLWIKKLGGLWTVLFSLLCLERLSLSEAVESVSCRYSAWDRERIEDAALTVLGRVPQCGRRQGLELPFEETEGVGKADSSPEQLLEKDEQEHLFAVLFRELLGEGDGGQVLPDAFVSLLQQGLSLNPEERLLLKLLYQDSVGVARAGRLL